MSTITNKVPVIIDTDPGIDDTMAILYSIVSSLPIQGFTTIYGNATIDSCSENLDMVLDFIGWRNAGIYPGASSPLNKQPRLAEAHGISGLGTFKREVQKSVIAETSAVNFLQSELKQGKRTILCLGPLTNIAELVIQAPELKENIEEIILLGGAFHGVGNVSPYGEFNIYNDPDALEIIINSNVATVIIPMEVCQLVTISREDIDATLSRSSFAKAVHEIVDVFIDYYQKDSTYGGFSGAVMYDLLVPAYYLNRSLFSQVNCRVNVDTSTLETRGRTSMSAGLPQVSVVTWVNAKVLKEEFLAALANIENSLE